MAFRTNWTPDQYMNIIRKVAPEAVPAVEQAAEAGNLDIHKLREIQEANGHDDITPGMSDNAWLNGYLAAKKQFTKVNPPAPNTPDQPNAAPTAPQPAAVAEPKGVQDQAKRDAYMRLKNKQGTDADLDMFAGYSEEQLKKIGFGPVSIKAIMDKAASKTQVAEPAQTPQAPLPKGTTNGEEATAAADAAMQKRHAQDKADAAKSGESLESLKAQRAEIDKKIQALSQQGIQKQTEQNMAQMTGGRVVPKK